MATEPTTPGLRAQLAEIWDLKHVTWLLEWDQQCFLPPAAGEGRAEQLGTLQRLVHERLTSEELGREIDRLAERTRGLDPDSDEVRLVAVSRRVRDRLVRVPADLVGETARVTGVAYGEWTRAREQNDFARFQPHMERIVDLKRRLADCLAPYDHVYDPLLDEYEPAMKTADVRRIFGRLRDPLVAMIRSAAERPPVDDSFLRRGFDEAAQWAFATEVVGELGYDWSRGRQDRTVHPFSISLGFDDVRITTRVAPNYFPTCLFGSVHEAGHAMYEQGFDRSLARSPLADGASLGVHESQSRLWENLVARSLPFWEHFYPRLRARFPGVLDDVGLEAFHRGINRVSPSSIRVEADEATYNLHIMLRLDLEIRMIEGTLAVKDLPAAWNAAMKEYLGVVPPDDAHGVLQDVHWSGGSIGYFPTYALGNLIAAQLWERIQADLPGLDEDFRHGRFGGLLAWLRAAVHRHGAKFAPQELVRRVTGSPIDPAPYLRYLEGKLAAVYGR
jgi:carboxypeptidase Taq